MNIFFLNFCIFASLSLISGLFVVISKNPVYSVLFLVLTFCNVSSLLFLLNLEFLPVTFIVVYVGALAVLFLFVLMMLNIKIASLKAEYSHFMPLLGIILIVFIIDVFALMSLDFLPLSCYSTQMSFLSDFCNVNVSLIDTTLFYNQLTNMPQIGQVLFVDYAYQFIVVGFILLLAMIGAIKLTLQKLHISRTQSVYFQILRNFNASTTFYN